MYNGLERQGNITRNYNKESGNLDRKMSVTDFIIMPTDCNNTLPSGVLEVDSGSCCT